MKEKKQKLIDITTVKFLLVGVINTLVGTGTMFGLYNCLGCSYWVSSAGNYIVGSIVSYFLNKYFTFKNHQKSAKTVLKFVVNIAGCIISSIASLIIGAVVFRKNQDKFIYYV